MQGSVWESYCSLSICLILFRVSACFAHDKTVINQRRGEKSAFEDKSEENSVWILKWTTLLRIFCKISFTPAVTFCYQVHAPKTDTQLHTFLLRRYTVTHTVTHIPTAAIHSYTQLHTTDTQLHTFLLLCYSRCHWCRSLCKVNCILHWIVLNLSTLQLGITLAIVVA